VQQLPSEYMPRGKEIGDNVLVQGRAQQPPHLPTGPETAKMKDGKFISCLSSFAVTELLNTITLPTTQVSLAFTSTWRVSHDQIAWDKPALGVAVLASNVYNCSTIAPTTKAGTKGHELTIRRQVKICLKFLGHRRAKSLKVRCAQHPSVGRQTAAPPRLPFALN
jgi:hypothetical protein